MAQEKIVQPAGRDQILPTPSILLATVTWHIHHATKGGGQMLIGVAGRGWYQEEGKPAQEILPGTVIHIPAGVKHWHGAAADSWFAHLAFEIAGENASNEWLEPVTDEEYGKVLVAYFSATGITAQAAQKVAD